MTHSANVTVLSWKWLNFTAGVTNYEVTNYEKRRYKEVINYEK